MRELKENSEKQEELNTSLEVAVEKAEKSSRIKSEFLATMSHEIRTPLNAIVGMSNVMLMGNPRSDQKENLEVLKLSANNLMAIVNDVLDFNKIDVYKRQVLLLQGLTCPKCAAQTLRAPQWCSNSRHK